MPVTDEMRTLQANRDNWQALYEKSQAVLKYPADWLIRLNSMLLAPEVGRGKMLDYAFGSANNSIFLAQQGWEVWGVEIAPACVELARRNFEKHDIKIDVDARFTVTEPGGTSLPYPDDFFDFVLCNESMYYNPTEQAIQGVLRELKRCMKPGGIIAVTMMGPRCVYIARFGHKLEQPHLYEVHVVDPEKKLRGVRQYDKPPQIFVVEDPQHLKKIFSDFTCLTVGHVDQGMFDLESTFHWLFVGRK